jgi:peptidoglycan/xylan/chitin deacetylase (PgdA/CDA1 family)
VHGPREAKRFALTYDDGPGAATSELLHLLAEHSARATFFMVGRQAEVDPDLARRVARAHEVGSHSYAHLDHEACGSDRAVDDMMRGASAIEGVIGVEPLLYRAPYGHFTAATQRAAERLGWTCVKWSALGNDWEPDATGRSAASKIVGDLSPGAIVLLHDARREHAIDPAPMLQATELVLAAAAERDLQPATVGELLAAGE